MNSRLDNSNDNRMYLLDEYLYLPEGFFQGKLDGEQSNTYVIGLKEN
jgi:hypothetical protein